jgi:hypothetical protein
MYRNTEASIAINDIRFLLSQWIRVYAPRETGTASEIYNTAVKILYII